ncbi:hypothetical protein LRR81_05255 [Metabacillus sp. GX 13764]|uniref:hypothetical protein n=1 Tax=Metabacillus kandeliae TaxID=2900151 RepID=UPI001E37EB84|nr:hypothetical protein [Metabacillus kandeliae]MCD7033631.1 hypothetical protein [Metabacillus kandeliae]
MKKPIWLLYIIAFSFLIVNQSLAAHTFLHHTSKIYLDDEYEKHGQQIQSDEDKFHVLFGEAASFETLLVSALLMSAVFFTAALCDFRFRKFLLSVFYQSSYFRKASLPL